MGGNGSGRRWYSGARDTVENCRAVDVRRWKREGVLLPGYQFGWQWMRNGEKVAGIDVRVRAGDLVLSYRVRPHGAEEWESVEEPVILEQTPGTYGGQRFWFRCPLAGCGRRVALLYLGQKYFGCRHCYRLVYQSTREGLGGRATNRADKIRARLGWEPGILNGNGDKPKWMRWSTYLRLTSQHEHFLQTSLHSIAQRFGGLGFDLEL